MARGGGRRSAAPAPARRPAVAAPTRSAPPAPRQAQPPAPQPAAHPPAPQQSGGGGGMLAGMAGTIAQGFAFGTGSAVAHRAVGAVANSFGGSDAAPVQEQQAAAAPAAAAANACDVDQQNFYNCLQRNNGDVSSCNFLYESLQSCQRNSTHSYA